MAQNCGKKGFNSPFKRAKAALKAAHAGAKAAAPAAARPPLRPMSVAPTASDAELFARAIAGTVALGDDAPRLPAKLPPVLPPPTDDAIAIAELEDLVRGNGTFRVHESEEVLFGLAPGVNFVLLDNLKRGHYAYEHCIDLHGMVREVAHVEVARFISQARCRDGASCVLVVTGRGRSSPDGTSVLRESLPRWLTRAPIRAHVLAFCTARAVDGGPGAFYVLLRRQGVHPFGGVVP